MNDRILQSPDDRALELTVLPSSLQALLFTDIVDLNGIKACISTEVDAASLLLHKEIVKQTLESVLGSRAFDLSGGRLQTAPEARQIWRGTF